MMILVIVNCLTGSAFSCRPAVFTEPFATAEICAAKIEELKRELVLPGIVSFSCFRLDAGMPA